jgi:hypothetical protein
MEESNVGFPYDLSAILSFDGEVASARSRRNLRIHGWNDTPAEIEMGFFEANFTDDTAGSEDTTLSLFLKQAGVDVESVRWSPASTSVPSLELTAPAAAPQQPSAAPGLFTISAIIDLTAAAATYVIIPPTVARFRAVSIQWEIKTTNTVTVAPTYSVGTNAASFNNVVASVTPAAFTTQAAETAITLTVAAPVQVADMTASGLVLNVTNPATATALTARITVAYGLAPV